MNKDTHKQPHGTDKNFPLNETILAKRPNEYHIAPNYIF